MDVDNLRMSPWTMEQDTNVSALNVYLDGGLDKREGTQLLNAVIYENGSGQPGRLLYRSEEITIPAGREAGWEPLRFSRPVSLDGGKTYWFGLHSGPEEGLARFHWSKADDALWVVNDPYEDGPLESGNEERSGVERFNKMMCWRITPD